MRAVFIESASEGMCLARAVMNAEGQLLLEAGVILSENHIRFLKSWGIQSIDVDQGDAQEPSDALGSDPRWLKEEERLERVFRDVRDDPLMQEVYEVVRHHIAGRLNARIEEQ